MPSPSPRRCTRSDRSRPRPLAPRSWGSRPGPGVDLETISAAYDDHRIVRGSNIRGTVHTSTPEDNPLLEVATRIGQRALWERTLKLGRTTLEDVWAGIEDFARDDWRTPAELSDASRRLAPGARRRGRATRLDNQAGRYFGFGHGGLVRRPLKGGWQAQAAPGYRTASALIGDRSAVLADPDAAMDALVRRHVAAYGPASRHDLAWWAGVGLRVVDASLERLADELTDEDGSGRPRRYHDLPALLRRRAARESGCCRSSTLCSAASTRGSTALRRRRSTTAASGPRATG